MNFLRRKVVVPVWFLIFGAFSLVLAIINRLFVPSVRWFFRSRANEMIHNVNDRLAVQLPEFTLTKRKEQIGRLVYDPHVIEAVAEHAIAENQPRDVVFEQVERYAREIIPAFNAYTYFRIGVGISTRLTNMLYNVRLGWVDQASLQKLNRNASIVFVMNHRSNMDYVLLGHIARDYVALSYAVGEWANVFPIKQLISGLGGYFVRRGSGNKLYRRVLERYVQLATEGGVVQAMFPEGRLTRDGKLQSPRLGLLDYMLRTFNSNNKQDLFLIPVAVNYDLVLEDELLVRTTQRELPKQTRLEKLWSVRANSRLLRQRGLHGFGYSVVNLGTPISLRAYSNEKGIEFNELPKDERIEHTKGLAQTMLDAIGEIVPVLPVAVLANVFGAHEGEWISAETIDKDQRALIETLTARGAHIYAADEHSNAISSSLSLLTQRGLIETRNYRYRAVVTRLPVLRYYANSISHLLEGNDA